MKATDAAGGNLAREVFAALADGEFHSGADLAKRRNLTRGGIWKAIENLRLLGLPIEAVPNRGYRLMSAIVPLSSASIGAHWSPELRARIASCDVIWECASTNSELLEAPTTRPGTFRILLAENQTAGRGRRGRTWQAALGGGLCLSLGFSVDPLPTDFGALTLAIGVAVHKALAAAGVRAIRLKWPNDLVDGPRKLGGILTELRAEAGGPAWVVTGIGLNTVLPAGVRLALERTGTQAGDLVSLGLTEDRNQLAARVVQQCMVAIDEFLRAGLQPFADYWRACDALLDREVSVESAAGRLTGRARGIDSHGALRLETTGGEIAVVAGEVSARSQVESRP